MPVSIEMGLKKKIIFDNNVDYDDAICCPKICTHDFHWKLLRVNFQSIDVFYSNIVTCALKEMSPS